MTDKMEALFQAQRKLETALAEVGIHGSHVAHTRLQLRLENDEPKCANCAKWGRIVVDGMDVTTGICNGAARSAWKGTSDGGSTSCGLVTTDLTVCSKWEPRP